MEPVTAVTVWLTDDECPACGAALVLLGHGQPLQVLECRACGWSRHWDLTEDDNGNGNGKAGDAQ